MTRLSAGTLRYWRALRLYMAAPTPSLQRCIPRWSTSLAGRDADSLERAAYALKFSGDSRRLLSYSEQTKQVWDAGTGQPIGHALTGCTVEGGRKDNVALSRDGHRVAAGCDDNTVRVWDADTGEPVGKPMQGHEYPPRDVAFTPDGRRIVSVSLDSVRLWDTDTEQRIAEHQPPRAMDAYDSFSGLAVSSDGRYIVTGGNKSIYRWDGTTGDPIGEPMRGLQNERNDVLAFTHDGRYIVSSDLGALRFWDTATGASVGELLNPMGRYATNTLVVGPDDRMLYTSSLDGEFLWPGPAAWHEMCDKLTANMSHKQWSEWVSPNIGYEKLCEHLDVPPDDQGK
jgi:WD40 repeat protein